MKDRCGFLFVRYKRHCCTELVSWEHAACPLSGIKKRPLVGGWLNTSSVVISIGATASVRYREVVRSWEGPLWEVPLYTEWCKERSYQFLCLVYNNPLLATVGLYIVSYPISFCSGLQVHEVGPLWCAQLSPLLYSGSHICARLNYCSTHRHLQVGLHWYKLSQYSNNYSNIRYPICYTTSG